MTPFMDITAEATRRRGGAAALKKVMPEVNAAKALISMSDDRYLSRMSFRVFASGLRHSMVEKKWPDFEDVFLGFEPRRVRAMSDETLEGLLKETRIIRHWGKIKATRANAAAMCDIAGEFGNFGTWLAAWPESDIVGLWEEIKQRFSQMGRLPGPYFLRMIGKDTFVLTRDVVRALNKWGAYDGDPKGKRAKVAVQEAFNTWADETGRPLCELSRILALSVD